jgi:hypothetical protein
MHLRERSQSLRLLCIQLLTWTVRSLSETGSLQDPSVDFDGLLVAHTGWIMKDEFNLEAVPTVIEFLTSVCERSASFLQVDCHDQKIIDQFYANKKIPPQHFDSDPLKLVSRALNPVADQKVSSAGLHFIFCMLHVDTDEASWTGVRDVLETLFFDDLMVLLVCCTNDVGNC